MGRFYRVPFKSLPRVQIKREIMYHSRRYWRIGSSRSFKRPRRILKSWRFGRSRSEMSWRFGRSRSMERFGRFRRFWRFGRFRRSRRSGGPKVQGGQEGLGCLNSNG